MVDGHDEYALRTSSLGSVVLREAQVCCCTTAENLVDFKVLLVCSINGRDDIVVLSSEVVETLFGHTRRVGSDTT